MPRMARRVVCGLEDVIAIFCATSALVRVDFPALGRPIRLINPARCSEFAATITYAPGFRDAARSPHLSGLQLWTTTPQLCAHPHHARGSVNRVRPPARGLGALKVACVAPRYARLPSTDHWFVHVDQVAGLSQAP